MFSAKKKSSGKSPDLNPWRKAKKLLAPRRGDEFRPRLSMRVWLTALFVLVTAFAGLAAYRIVHPILYETLDRSSEAAFKQVGDQFEAQVQRLRDRDEALTEQRISAFARSHGLQWGIIKAEGKGGFQTQGNLDEWSASAVKRALAEPRRPSDDMEQIQTGAHKGQLQATYAYPINVDVGGKTEPRAVVFVKFFTKNDVENVQAALSNIERLALLAGALALLIAGFAGYFAAVLISRRVSR